MSAWNPARPSPCASLLRPDLIERRLRRFPSPVQARVRRLAARHMRLADLALSFPALLFDLAVPRFGLDPEPLIARVMAGEALSILAAKSRVPLWLRRLEPECCLRPLPALPDSPFLRLRIANHVPRSPRIASVWLRAVAIAAEAAEEDVVAWMARETSRRSLSFEPSAVRLVSLWAWFSRRKATQAGRLCDIVWTAEIGFKAAHAMAEDWRRVVIMHLCLGGGPIADCWLPRAVIDGYEVVPLETTDAVRAEARAMENCLMDYARPLAVGASRLWSIRRGDERVATLEIGACGGSPLLQVRQLRGPRNGPVSVEVWRAVRTWMRPFDHVDFDIEARRKAKLVVDVALWRDLWRPYWRFRRRIPAWLPSTPSLAALREL